jgi:Family of unknown function (DUF6644)
MHYLLPIFKFFDKSWLATFIADSRWLFPAIEAVHIVALCITFGAILMLNLRLLGIAFNDKPVAHLARELAPWVFCSLLIILASGLMLFSSEAMKAYTSVPFQVKMLFLFAAIVFHYTIYKHVTTTDDSKTNHAWAKLAAITSIVLWLGVGVGGRGIGFL